HNGNAVSIEIRIFEEKVRDRATNSNETTQTVIDNCLTNLSDHAVARLPGFKHIKRNIQKQRGQNNLPKIPHDKTFDRIPDQLTTTKRNTAFLQYDSGPGNDRIIIFHHLNNYNFLKIVNNYYLMEPLRNAVLPVIFALLPNKTEQTYRRLIDKASELCPLWNPKYIMMDY
ncbi:unnamed protein product, partial [Rotaria socialis]